MSLIREDDDVKFVTFVTIVTLVFAVVACIFAVVGCGALAGGTIGTIPPIEVPTYSFGIVACGTPVAPTSPCLAPIAGATIAVNGTSGYVSKTADANGYSLFVSLIPFSDVKISAPGYVDLAVGIEPPKIAGTNVSLSLKPLVTSRRGLVRANGKVFSDDGGPYLAVGASLFWAGWGCENDQPRLVARNLVPLKRWRADYIRAIAVVGPTGWSDRTAAAAGAAARVACATDLAAAHGLRVDWVIFGNVDTAPTPAERESVVRAVAAVLATRTTSVQYLEIANEGWQTGFGGADGIAEMRKLARIVRELLPGVLVSLTSPQTDLQIAELYDGSPATLMGVHPDRNITGQGGIWRPVRQAWDYRDSRIPWVIDEPIGQKSTVAEDFDPVRQSMAAANGWLTGAAGYVVHAGAGIRGGGKEDRDRGREANWDEVPGAAAVFAAINVMRGLLPPDLPNFQHHNAGWATYPFESSRLVPLAERNGYLRAFAATSGDGRLVVLPMLAVEPIPFQARRPMHLEVHDPLTGALLEQVDLAVGQTFTLSPRDAAVLVGR